MELDVRQVSINYSSSTWHSVEFTLPNKDDFFRVTVEEMYDGNSDSTAYHFTCVHGKLSGRHLEKLEQNILFAIEEERSNELKVKMLGG